MRFKLKNIALLILFTSIFITSCGSNEAVKNNKANIKENNITLGETGYEITLSKEFVEDSEEITKGKESVSEAGKVYAVNNVKNINEKVKIATINKTDIMNMFEKESTQLGVDIPEVSFDKFKEIFLAGIEESLTINEKNSEDNIEIFGKKETVLKSELNGIFSGLILVDNKDTIILLEVNSTLEKRREILLDEVVKTIKLKQ